MANTQPDYVNIARKYISNSMENGFARMHVYGWLDDYLKGFVSRKELVKTLTHYNIPQLKICSLLAELDAEESK